MNPNPPNFDSCIPEIVLGLLWRSLMDLAILRFIVLRRSFWPESRPQRTQPMGSIQPNLFLLYSKRWEGNKVTFYIGFLELIVFLLQSFAIAVFS
jgi:hypothetical protein